MLNAAQQIDILEAYSSIGEQRFYRLLLSNGIKQLASMPSELPHPELQYLDMSDKLLILFRREKQPIYLDLSRIFRRAAHKLYKVSKQIGLSATNKRFLQLVP
jgi:hypothetical protein